MRVGGLCARFSLFRCVWSFCRCACVPLLLFYPVLCVPASQSSIRPYWRCYYPNTHAIVFVVDSADTDRLDTARAELMAMLEVGACGVVL